MGRILKCKCAHEFQDGRYGKNMRVHNATREDTKGTNDEPVKFRCTVCGDVKGRG